MGSNIYKWILGTLVVVGVAAAVNSANTTAPSLASVTNTYTPVQSAPYQTPQQPTPAPRIFRTNLSLDSSGTEVANVQQFLADEGFYSGPDSGFYDRATLDAAIAFENQEGITPADGYWGYNAQTSANTILASHPDWITYLSNNNSYTNVNGSKVNSPSYSTNGVPAGASAVCGDGTYSFSMHHSGTCSHHGGVSQWLQ